MKVIAGLDEVGWGALAGPVISVVAAFREKDLALLPPGVTDSKKLTKDKLQSLFHPLCFASYDVGIGHAWPWEMDIMGPAAALQLSYKRAIEDMVIARPDVLYVDGTRRVAAWKGPQIVEPKGDLKWPCVSAASIIAKVFRDQIMRDYAKDYPLYAWDENKGYGSKAHSLAIQEHGLMVNDVDRTKYFHRKRYCRGFTYKENTNG